ncbi:hypothetical protein [Indiicoccus explosivorum]|nr:hypothetical protein [Indiicoccus explosivorum]
MLLYLTTVIGFMALITVVIFANMFFISRVVVGHDAEKVDPKPAEKY